MRIGILIHGIDVVDFDVYKNHLEFIASLPKGYEYAFLNIRNTKIAQARNELVKIALENKCDKILFIDTDHILPLDMLEKLLQVEASVVSGLICKRRDSFHQVGYVKQEDGKFASVNIPLKTGHYEVDTCAFGCTLIDTKVFTKLKEPYFYDGGSRELRSDLNFCLDVKDLGEKIIIQSDVLCGHLISERQVVYPYNNHKIKEIFNPDQQVKE